MLTAIQIAINTPDMAGSLRFYSEVFGFRNAGGQGSWGATLAAQGLPPESRAIQWWLVGSQEFFQLEFFQHSLPANRPLPDGWRPSDFGWTRFGLRIDQFDRRLEAVRRWGIEPITAPKGENGHRRVAFHDPVAGAVVELIEAAPGEPVPAAVYAASSVPDLDAARSYYAETLGFPILSLDTLHAPEDEALWGLSGAKREGFIADAGNILIEVLRYETPAGRPRREDYRLSDQGLVNVAVGSYDVAEAASAIERAQARGLTIPQVFKRENVIACLVTDSGYEMEIAGLPPEVARLVGFEAAFPFLDQSL